MDSEAVSTRVTTGRLGNTCLLHGSFDGTLDTQILATRDSTSHKFINANRLHEPKCSRLEGCQRNTIKQIKHLLVFEL
jgi:hypothetical protein